MSKYKKNPTAPLSTGMLTESQKLSVAQKQRQTDIVTTVLTWQGGQQIANVVGYARGKDPWLCPTGRIASI